jgi:CO dehydrogenase nickel-insertion accessory protein CooC1
MMTGTAHALQGKRIGVFGKGGAGKSTVVVLLARALRRRGYEVCVVDADSTNAGLAAGFGLERVPEPLMHRFGGTVFTGGAVTCPVDDPTPLPSPRIDLDAVEPAYVSGDGAGLSLLSLGKITEDGPGAGCDGPVAKIARDLEVERGGRDVLTLLDFKAGFEDWARGVITTLDWAVVVVDPTTAAVDMAGHMDDVVRRIRAGAAPATHHLDDPRLVEIAEALYRDARVRGTVCVLNNVPDAESEAYLRAALARRSITPVATIHEDRAIAGAWMRGDRLEADGRAKDAAAIVDALEAAEADAA